MYKYPSLNDTVYFQFPVNNSDGSGSSGILPSVKVRKSGDAASAAPIYTATPYLLTNALYPQGCYETAIPATTGNGFIYGGDYGAFATIAISSQNPTGYIGGFLLGPINSSASAAVSQNDIASGVLRGLGWQIPSNPNSGSINYIFANLATQDTFFEDLLNTVITSYQTMNTVGKSLNNIASGSLQASNAPTVTQIRQEIDSNSTQLSTLATRLSALRAGYLDNLSSGLVATQAQAITITAVINAIKAISDQISFTSGNINSFIKAQDNIDFGTTQKASLVTAALTNPSGVVTLLNRIIGTISAGTHFPQSGDGFTVSQNILAVANKLDTMMELDGAVYQFTTNALLNSPTSTGGFTTDDRLLITGINSTTSILNTMIENVSGYRYTTKSLETVGNNINLANTKLDISSGVLSNIYNQTNTTGVKVQDVETGLSFIHAMQAIFALTAKMTGGGTTTVKARNHADNKDRITWTTDSSNNRLTVTFNFD